MKKLTRTITFGATAAALFTLIYTVFAIDEGMTQELVSLVAVMPLALFVCMSGIRAGILATLAALGLSLFLVQPTVYITYTIPNALIGLTLGIMALRAKPMLTLGAVSGMNFLHFVYEILVTKYIFKIDAYAEYKLFINSVTAFFTDGSKAAQIAHDMAFCFIPTLFLLAAVAKAFIFCAALFILLKRLFKKNINLKIPRIQFNERALAYVFFSSEIATACIAALTLSNVISSTFACALMLDIEFVIMYLFLIYHLYRLGSKVKLRNAKGMLLTLALILFFPFSDNYFAAKSLIERQ